MADDVNLADTIMMVTENKVLDTVVTYSSIRSQIPPLQLMVHKILVLVFSEIDVFLFLVGEG